MEYASGRRAGITPSVFRSMTRASVQVRNAIQRAREQRGLEPLPFDSGTEMLAESRRQSAGILARLKATLAHSRR
jgi:hypothetical protein